MGIAGFEEVLKGLTARDLVITGEGSLDDPDAERQSGSRRGAGRPGRRRTGDRRLRATQTHARNSSKESASHRPTR